MKVLIIILLMATSCGPPGKVWAQLPKNLLSPSYFAGPAKMETEDEELRRLLKMPDPPPYVAPKTPDTTELEKLRAENSRLKAQASQASTDKWMYMLGEIMASSKESDQGFNQQMMLWEMQKQTEILRQQQQLEQQRQQWIQNQSIWNSIGNSILYQRRIPNCYTGAFGIVNCW